jgi:hypothetical protein
MTENGSPSERLDELMQGEHGVLYRDNEVTPGETPKDAVIVDGVVRSFGFHPDRLEQARPKVIEIIREVVEDPFFTDKGGGYTFLNLCQDRSGNQWAEHPTMEVLCCLAIGLKLAKWCAPREMWPMLPGGMPYIQFDPLPSNGVAA